MDERVLKRIRPMQKQPGASLEALNHLQRGIGVALPEDYLEFLRWYDGAVGEMRPYLSVLAGRGVGAWVELFSIQEVLQYAKSELSVPRKWRKLLPGCLAIGGGARYVAFINLRSGPNRTALYAVGDYLGEEDAFPLMYQLGTFAELVEHLSTVYLQLTRADLQGLDLRNARLLGAQLGDALLIGADLTGADLRNAWLVGRYTQKVGKCGSGGVSSL